MCFLPALEGHLVVGDLGARSTSWQYVKAPTNEMVPWIMETVVSIRRGEGFEVLSAFKILKCATFRLIARLTRTQAKAPT